MTWVIWEGVIEGAAYKWGYTLVKMLPQSGGRHSFNRRSEKERPRLGSNYSVFQILLYFCPLEHLKIVFFPLGGKFLGGVSHSMLGAYQNFLFVLAPT